MKNGDKVVCIDASILPSRFLFVKINYPMWVTKGKQYTIREILPNDDIVPGILLEEIINPSIYIKLLNKAQEPAFRIDRFRLLEDSEQIVEEEVEELDLVNI